MGNKWVIGVYGYDPGTKTLNRLNKSVYQPPTERASSCSNQCQSHVVVFFVHEGVVHHEYSPVGQTADKEYYVEVLRRLHRAVWRKRSTLHQSGG